MIRVSSNLFPSLFLVCMLACSQNKKMASHEEYPDFSQHDMATQEPAITVCGGSRQSRARYHIVEIKQLKFLPAELSVQMGDTIVWVNCDIVNHDVTEESRRLWQSPSLAPNQSWQKIVTESADYYCSIHVVMKAKVIVR